MDVAVSDQRQSLVLGRKLCLALSAIRYPQHPTLCHGSVAPEREDF